MNKKNFIYLGLFIFVFLLIFYSKKLSCSKQISNNYNLQNALNLENIVPVAIIGSGPAGLCAGLYTSRLGFKTLIFEGSQPGGQLMTTTDVENWMGIKTIMGPKLMSTLKDHTTTFGATFSTDVITKVDFTKWPFELYTNDNKKINALSVIIATGSKPKTLQIPGETEYWGKGVTTCAVCDAPFYKNKDVVVIGGGDSAIEKVLQLAPYAKEVTMLVRKNLRASQAMQDRLQNIKNAKVLYNKELKKISGDNDHVNEIEVFDNVTNELTKIKMDGVFLAIGHNPNTDMFKGQIELDNLGYIKAQDRSQRTSVDGVMTAGDVDDHVYMQAISSAGEGCKSGIDASMFLQGIGFNPEIAKKFEDKFVKIEKNEPSKVIVITKLEELNNLSKESMPVILDFWAEYCPTCIQMLPFFEALSARFDGKMKFVKINIDEAEDIVKQLFVLKVPSFIVMKEGQIVARYNDVMDKIQMTKFVEQFV